MQRGRGSVSCRDRRPSHVHPDEIALGRAAPRCWPRSACLQQNDEFITALSSNNIARDIDILRRSLNERQIGYAGISFGTVLGAVYASLFPHNVRAMLLDAGVLPAFRDGAVEFRAEQSLSFETTLQRLDQLCKADAGCRLRGSGARRRSRRASCAT